MNEFQSTDESGGVYALAAAGTNDAVLFAATGRGLLRSLDRGATFDDAYQTLELPAALPTAAVAVSPAFEHDRTVFAGVTGAVLRSRDGGEHWQYASLRNPPPAVTCLGVSPHYEEDGVAFAGTLEDGVFRSADRGALWAAWNFGLIDLGVLCLALSPAYGQDETLFAGTETGLFRSTNGGRAWRETSFPSEMAPVLCLAVSPAYGQDGTVYAGTEAAGLWISRDRGTSWTVSVALAGQTINAVTVEGRGRMAVLADERLLTSSDGGASFSEVLLEHADGSPVCLAAQDRALVVGTSDGRILTAAW